MAEILKPAFKPTYKDLVAALRLVADELENGELDYHTVVLVGLSDAEVGIHSLGMITEDYAVLGILSRGMHAANCLKD